MSQKKSNKTADLCLIALIYLIAFIIGVASANFAQDTILKYFIFDTIATVVTFVFSVILTNSSIYDAYWSLTPMVMVIVLFIRERAFSPWQIIFLIVFCLWSMRLTINWITVFTDFTYEDWRYRKFRDETPKLFWPLVNFFGIHYMPTLFVFAGMLPIFVIVKMPLGPLSLFGIAVMLIGIFFEYLADREMHAYLNQTSDEAGVCRRGLWRYSRHPNYLGEIMVWLGVYLVMLPYAPSFWYRGIGFLGMVLMFNIISIPLMEKRQLAKRPAYAAYRRETSRLLLLPVKEKKN